MKKWLEKIRIDGQEAWYFVSEGRGTTRFRELPYPHRQLRCFDKGDGTKFETIQVLAGESLKATAQRLSLQPDQISKEQLPQWVRIITEHESPSNAKTIVLTTPLRQLYEFMRDGFDDRDFRKNLLNAFEKEPMSLAKLCNESFAQFSSYENITDDWGLSSKRKLLPESPPPLDEAKRTEQVVSVLSNSNVLQTLASPFTYMEREFNPRRTTNGVFENGLLASSSGIGGIDILLRNSRGKPVVGEIKIRDDADPFYALIQCLTYAVELGTTNQLKRLAKHGIATTSGFTIAESYDDPIEICIICIEHNYVEFYEKLTPLAEALSQSLSFIGKIYLVSNRGNGLRLH